MHFFEQSLQCSMSEPISTTSASSTCQCASSDERMLTRSDWAGFFKKKFSTVRRNSRRRATRSRRPDCPRRECVPPRRDALRDGADGTRLEGCGSAARLALVAEASPSKSRAWLSPQLSR